MRPFTFAAMVMQRSLLVISLLNGLFSFAQDSPRYGRDKFRQLDQELPTPNEQRTASGAPGHAYWQMKADYDITVEIDDASQKLTGTETITYHNQSPDKLEYLWLQLDQNIFEPGSDANLIRTGTIGDSVSLKTLERWTQPFDGGFRITSVTDAAGAKLKYTINKTMMRIDLPKPLAPGAVYSFKVAWWFPINDRDKVGGRSGYEHFPEEDNYLYTIAQFYPRMCAYMDYSGWMHKQFLGQGEFTLDFGDYTLSITVPSDHIVGATGTLQNEGAVLTATQRERLAKARKADKPVMIVTPEEAVEAEKKPASAKASAGKKTWVYKAQNVRDVAFASSRKFIWDGMNQPVGKNNVLCMSFYPMEGNPLWEQYSTKVVAHTIKTYSKYTIDYTYPVAISVHTDRIGMEYPMICFNGGRPEKDGTYSERIKYGMIGVIIHEVGHNFFPMIINSDERQWTWMDEGLNTFVQYLTEQEWDKDYPSWRGKPRNIVDYMKGDPNAAPGQGEGAHRTHHDQQREHHAVRQQRLRQALHGAQHPARDGDGPRAVRPRLQDLRRALEVQAPHAGRLLPHHGGCQRRGPRLVLARLVLHHRPCGHRHHRSQVQAHGPARSLMAEQLKRQDKAAEPIDLSRERNKTDVSEVDARKGPDHPAISTTISIRLPPPNAMWWLMKSGRRVCSPMSWPSSRWNCISTNSPSRTSAAW
jgi:hypothetical protein